MTEKNAVMGRRLRAYRSLLGFEQRDMARYLTDLCGTEVNQQSVSAWERGVRVVPAAVLEVCREAAEVAERPIGR